MATSSLPIPHTADRSSALALAVPLARLLFVLMFLLSGPRHFLAGTIQYAASQGVPLASLAVPFTGVLALAGGLSILLGFRARIGSLLIAIFLLLVTPLMHKFWGVADPMAAQMQLIMFFKNLSMLGGALLIAYFGSGPYSLDGGR